MFATKGVVDVTVADVAAAAGCTRGTVHRHFGDRESLRLAFVEHHAALVAGRVARQIASLDEPGALLVEAVVRSVAEVRADPLLAAWFTDASATTSGRLALQADLVRDQVAGLVGEVIRRAREQDRLRPGVDVEVAVDAVVRTILSLLSLPAQPIGRRPGAARERHLVEQIVAASILDP